MNLRTVLRHIKADILAGNAIILKGPPGFGKTELMTHVAAWLVTENPGKRVGLACFFMATQSSIGFTGLPWKGERTVEWEGKVYNYVVTDPAVPQWYMAKDMMTGEIRPGNLFDIVLLVIEEWGQGDAETKRAGAEVLRAGGTPPWYLPPGSPRIALTNIDARDGVTKEFDFIIGRRGEYEITGDVDVWIEDFADKPYDWQGKTWNVMPITKAWAKTHPEVLFEAKPEKQGPWCNPRTVCAVDRYAQVMATFNGGDIPINDPGFMEGVSGKIGMAATQSYIGHLQFAIELPRYEDVVKDPKGTPVPSKADLQMLMAYELAGRTKAPDLGPVIEYMSRKEMPKDMAVTFVSSLMRRDAKGMLFEPPMQAWLAKNASIMSVVNALA